MGGPSCPEERRRFTVKNTPWSGLRAHLSLEAKDWLHLAKLLGEALVGHVGGRAHGTHEDLPRGHLEGYVVDVWVQPTVGLPIHGLWPQCGRHQEHRLAGQRAGGDKGQV